MNSEAIWGGWVEITYGQHTYKSTAISSNTGQTHKISVIKPSTLWCPKDDKDFVIEAINAANKAAKGDS